MNGCFDRAGGSEGEPHGHAQVRALREAYRDGRLVVSADSDTLARARREREHAIDARDVAEAMLRSLLDRR